MKHILTDSGSVLLLHLLAACIPTGAVHKRTSSYWILISGRIQRFYRIPLSEPMAHSTGQSLKHYATNGDPRRITGEWIRGARNERTGAVSDHRGRCTDGRSGSGSSTQGPGLTIAGFSDRASISICMLAQIEHGRTAPSLALLANAAGAFHRSVRGIDEGEEHGIVTVCKGEGTEILPLRRAGAASTWAWAASRCLTGSSSR